MCVCVCTRVCVRVRVPAPFEQQHDQKQTGAALFLKHKDGCILAILERRPEPDHSQRVLRSVEQMQRWQSLETPR